MIINRGLWCVWLTCMFRRNSWIRRLTVFCWIPHTTRYLTSFHFSSSPSHVICHEGSLRCISASLLKWLSIWLMVTKSQKLVTVLGCCCRSYQYHTIISQYQIIIEINVTAGICDLQPWCVPIHVFMHDSVPFCCINSENSNKKSTCLIWNMKNFKHLITL